MFAAQPWDWWIGLVLFAAGALAILGLVVGYVYKVVSPQYPRRGQQVQQAESEQKT
jgi:membrane protein implicated in regulation of membrane protease activity